MDRSAAPGFEILEEAVFRRDEVGPASAEKLHIAIDPMRVLRGGFIPCGAVLLMKIAKLAVVHDTLTGSARRMKSGSIFTPNPGPVGQRTTPFSAFNDDVSHVTGISALPLNSMKSPMLGVNEAKWTRSR